MSTQDKKGKKRPYVGSVGLDSVDGGGGSESNQLKVLEENSRILMELLTEIKITNKHLELLTEANLEEHNIEK